MIIIPAIDLRDHQVVRLEQGRVANQTIYSADPVAMAAQWVEQGATRLHLVDLNGAFTGCPVHFAEVKKICARFPKLEVEIGGGIRELEVMQKYFDSGVSYCILGTMAVKNPSLFTQAVNQFGKKIILGLDVAGESLATDGWDESGQKKIDDFFIQTELENIAEIIFTDITKDGMLAGMSWDQIKQVARLSPVPVIASGGLTSLADIDELKKIPNVSGVIAGKAIYEGRFTLTEAIARAGTGASTNSC